MIYAIALDDEPPALEVLQSFCDQIEGIELKKTFTRSDEALKYLKKYPTDLLFLDINMPSISGIDFFKKVPHKISVIFTTAYSEFAVEGFTLNATDYLLKPFSFSRFEQAVEKAKSQLVQDQKNTATDSQFLFIRADYSLIKIPVTEILFIEGLDDYLKIHIRNQKTVVARMTMKSILEKLPTDAFFRVHRSFIVSLSKIDRVKSKIIFIDKEEIPVSATYEADFFKILENR
ncbi:LytTR family DNA-binding domain-containing protein [Flavobacterium sp. CAU 1735]|uniref:LytR/AlgR family response regulator transcription factor n=1 Tax=Flavobacterium sp. CAU 1735 TaxID=3140361 RepID=UPI0032615F6E